MKLAREFLPTVTNDVYVSLKFREVHVGVGTGAGGCLLVTGYVDTEDAQAELERIISLQTPPVPVVYRLKILEHDPHAKP